MSIPIIPRARLILKEMRIWQWTKNALVFAPIIFGAELLKLNILGNVTLAFFAISFTASAVYIINDIFDISEDQKHPIKKNRPLASGLLSTKEAYLIIAVLLGVATILSLLVSLGTLALIAGYLVLNIFYSQMLKHKEIIDILMVSFFYLYRIFIGGVVSGLTLSGWLILTTFFLSLFMITGKRRAELITAKNIRRYSRKVLNFYNEKFLDAVLIMSLTLFMIFYSLYSVLQRGNLFTLTIFPVIFISLRYLYLIFARNGGEEPEKLIFKDREILIAGLILITYIVIVLYSGVSNLIKI